MAASNQELARRLSEAVKQVPSTVPMSTLACVQRELVSSKKLKSSRGLTSTKKIFLPENPAIVRPHCDACGCCNGLRSGLDGRCHCEECQVNSPKCSSPRMKQLNGDGNTCASFKNKLTQSAQAMRKRKNDDCHDISPRKANAPPNRMMSKKLQAQQQQGKKQTEQNQLPKEPEVKRVASLPKRTSTKEVDVPAKPTPSPPKKPEVKPSLAPKVKQVEAPKRVPSLVEPQVKPSFVQDLESTIRKPTSSLPRPSTACKKSFGASKKSKNFFDLLDSKYKRPHCDKCTTEGCLRRTQNICYCDPCLGLSKNECSSPRMADFKKSHPGVAYQSACDCKRFEL